MASNQLYVPLDEIAPSSFLEKYILNGSDGIIRFAAGKNVVLSLEPGEGLMGRDRDSSRVHTRVLSDYRWASEESYHGRVVAVHGNLIAYRLFNDSTGEAVRVLEKENSNRHLIKGFTHPTADLQWASHAPLLAVLDSNANLYVYHVDGNCVVTKYLNVMRAENSVPPGAAPRLSWCPFIPETEEPHDIVHMVAVYYGDDVELITLSAIKADLDGEEVTLEKIAGNTDCFIRLPKENITSDVCTVCISPDATAVAVAQGVGPQRFGVISFFIVDSEGARFAHRWQPETNWPIHDLIFLDNIDVNSETPEQFWKYAILANDEGRRLDLYESEGWRCIGCLRFESPDRPPKFAITVDPSARYIFFADYDEANVFCMELGYVGGVPHFAACTQITFCHTLVNVVPYSVTTNAFCGDTSLDDDASTCVVASLVALSQRSLLHLEFDLDTAHVENVSKEASDSKLLALSSAANKKSSEYRDDEANGSLPRRNEKENELLETVQSNLKTVMIQIARQSDEMERLRREDKAATESLIQQLKDEIVSRDERMLLKFESLICENRTATVEAIQTSLDLKIDCVTENLKASANKQQVVDSQSSLNEELVKSVRGAMMAVVVPALDSLCSTLFQQLNEAFRAGLDQYLRQLRSLQTDVAHSSATTGITSMLPGGSESHSLIQLIESQNISAAFEKALNQKDLSALMFVCNNVDPETLFGTEHPLSQTILLCILNQLAVKLEGETDLKFRYIENCLMALHVKDPKVAANYRQVLDRLQNTLTGFIAQESNSSYKRQARIILQLIMNLLK